MIQMSKERFEGCPVSELVQLATPVLQHRERLYRRYARKADNQQMMGFELERSIMPFEYYIVNMAQGYLGGKAPAYSVRKGDRGEGYAGEYNATIQQIQRYNDDGATFMELMHDYLITCAAYLYAYESGANEIVYTRLDARQTVAFCDYSTPPNLIGLARVWQEGKDTVVERVTGQDRRLYRNGRPEGEPEPHHWGDVPAVAFEQPDGIAVFEPALSVIDAYEQIANNIRSMTRYNDEAKLMISGYVSQFEPGTPEREREEELYYRAKSLFIGEGGKVEWLLKSVDYAGLLDVLKSYHDKITMLTGVPNMTDEAFSSADNASALGYKLYALDQYSAAADRVFRKGYLRLWEIITGRLNLKGGAYDFRDIDIVMQRNIPTDRDKSLDRASRAYQAGVISLETAINESQIEVDPKEEMERIEAEQDAAYQKALKQARATTPGEDSPNKDGPNKEGVTDG